MNPLEGMNPLEVAPSWLAYLNSGGVLGLMTFIVYMFFKRKVRTEGEVNDLMKMYETRLAEERERKQEWKDAATKQIGINEVQATQITKATDILDALTSQKGVVR